jgi:type III secretion protein SpaR/YscT/HrcT
VEQYVNSLDATDNYANLLLSLPQLAPITVLSVFFLTLARLLPILVQAPFLGAKNVPRSIRMTFAVALVAIFLPQNLLAVKTEVPFDMGFIGLMAKELMIGAVIGFLASAPFFIAQMAGSLIDHQRGSSALQVNDPTTQSQTGPIGILYNYALIAIFFSLGGPFIFFDGLANSYVLIPVDTIFHAGLFNYNVSAWKQLFQLAQKLFELAVQLSAPALIGILLTDFFLGIANRLAPQVQIVFLGISLKSWVGIALLAAAWALILQVMGKESIAWFKNLSQMIEQVGRAYVQQ